MLNKEKYRKCVLAHKNQSSHASVIQKHYLFLLETLDVKFSGLVTQLYSDQVISAVERDDIGAERTSFRANEKLLSALSRKSPQQFQQFLSALDNCGQRHVRNRITTVSETPPPLPPRPSPPAATSKFSSVLSSLMRWLQLRFSTSIRLRTTVERPSNRSQK